MNPTTSMLSFANSMTEFQHLQQAGAIWFDFIFSCFDVIQIKYNSHYEMILVTKVAMQVSYESSKFSQLEHCCGVIQLQNYVIKLLRVYHNYLSITCPSSLEINAFQFKIDMFINSSETLIIQSNLTSSCYQICIIHVKMQYYFLYPSGMIKSESKY